MAQLNQNTIDLQTILSSVNALPDKDEHITTAVLYSEQTLSEAQKAQARENIGALSDSTVIPTVPTNVSAFTNDAGYLTEHQDISGKLDASASAIEEVLGYTPANEETVNTDIAVERARIDSLKTYVTPQMYGAVGDGVTDDTEAFKQCFLHTNIYIPAGTYIVSDTIEVLKNTVVTGERRETAKIKTTADVLFNVQSYASFTDIQILGAYGSTATGIAFPQQYLRLRNVQFRDINIGILSNGESTIKYNSFEGCSFRAVNYPFYFETATAQFNTTVILGCEFNNYVCVLKTPFPYSISFDKCSFTGEKTDSYILDIRDSTNTVFDSCYIENGLGKFISENCDYGNIIVRNSWIYRSSGVFLTMEESKDIHVKFIESTIINSDSDESSFDAHIDGTNLYVDIVDCVTSLGSKSGRRLKITSADIASQYGVATNCVINGGYLTLDTLPIYNGEVE